MTNYVRVYDNNFVSDTTLFNTYSSATTAGPFTNLVDPIRSRCWETSGNFTIGATNNKIYINDGGDKTVTLSSANYATPTLMAAHVQTQLNASSSNWTCTYSTTTKKFTIGHTGSATLRLTQTSNAAWSTLGFTTSIDLTGTSFTADTSRIHTSEYFIIDLGYAANVTFFGLISTLENAFPISSSATINLYGNSINDWTSPPFTQALTRTDGGIFQPLTSASYRYFKFELIDKTNPLGSNLKFGYLYFGDHATLTRNISNGFQLQIVDPSDYMESEAGTPFFNTKPKFTKLSSLNLQVMDKTDRETMLDVFNRIGINNPFFIGFDPELLISTTADQLTKYVYFSDPPQFTHVIYDVFSMSFDLKEAR